MRKPLVAGNWKMNGTSARNAILLDKILAEKDKFTSVDVAIFPSAVYLQQVQKALEGSGLFWGTQNLSQFRQGAYTGEISAAMLKDFGCKYVLIGHSERRCLYAELDLDQFVLDHIVADKYEMALTEGVTPILCIGETPEEHATGQTEEVVVMGAEPNGLNINKECGSTEPRLLQAAVLKNKADLGIALDGDGDRLIMVDHRGELVDGDELLFVIARAQQRAGNPHPVIVGTLMSNLGLEQALESYNMALHRAQVGDRYVMEMLKETGATVGGEASGHIICLDKTTTGDGIVAALQVLAEMQETGITLNELRSAVIKFPQRLINVRVNKMVNLSEHAEVNAAIKVVEAKLGNDGRVLLRASGTEPVIRVMVEGRDAALINQLAIELAEVIETLL